MTARDDLPLAGLRVADFCWLIAGPATTRVLADLGAEVIKVETHTRDDQIRVQGGRNVLPPDRTATSPNAVFNDCNTGKLSITLNLNQPEGIQLAKELVARSDLVTNNFTGERMGRWGLGYDDLALIKPDIIMLSMPVMGTTGPYRQYGANGNGVIAYGGLDANMGFPARPPVGMGPLYSDFASPYFGIAALMAALHHRARTGEGQFIDLAQLQVAVSVLGTDVLEYTANGNVRQPDGNRSRDECPHAAYPCYGDDRWIAIAVASDEEWRALCDVIEEPQLTLDPRFATQPERRRNEAELDASIAAWTRTQDAWQAMHVLQAAGVAAGVVENVEDLVVRDPHMRAHHFADVTDAEGRVHYMTHRQPVRFDGETIALNRAPTFGEHNEYVFREVLGLSEEDYLRLLIEEVIY